MDDLDQLKKHIEFLETSLANVHAENSELQELNDSANERIEELESKVEELEDEMDDLEEEVNELETPSSRRPPVHFKLPDERPAWTHLFHVGLGDLGRGYLTVGTYPESDDVGEIFITMKKSSTEENPPEHLRADPYVVQMHQQVSELSAFLRGALDQLAIAVSIGLQRGIPLETYAKKYRGTNFPPYGMTRHPDIHHAKSLVDYIFRYLGMKYIRTEEWLPQR